MAAANAAPEAAAALDAAAAAPEGGGAGALANPDVAALMQALRGGDAAAQVAAATSVSKHAKALTERSEEESARFCDALVESGAVEALLQLLSGCSPEDKRAQESACALTWLTFSSSAGRRAVLAAGGIALMLRLLRAHGVGCGTTASLAATLLRFCMEEAAVREACVADSDFLRQVLAVLQHERTRVDVMIKLCQALCTFASHGAAAARNALRSAHCLAVLAALLSDRVEKDARGWVCSVLAHLQRADGQTLEAVHAPFFEEGIYAACVAMFGAATSSACDTSGSVALDAVTRLLATAFEHSSEALRPALRQYMLAQPGALAGVAHAARVCPATDGMRKWLVKFLMQLRDDAGLKAAHGLFWLLDTHFAACAVMQLRDSDEALVRLFVTQWRAASCLHVLASPLPHQALPAAVSLACLAPEGACFRKLLAGRRRLETFCDALVAAAVRRSSEAADDAKPAAADVSQQPRLWWQLLVFRHAIKSAVRGARLTAAVSPTAAPDARADEEPSAKRPRTSASNWPAALSAADVNVRRRDSTVLLIGGEPFYVNGALLEAHSTLLADVLRDAETLDPIALPLPSGVPADKHYILFHAAVEHAYTGGIATLMIAEELLPLFCLADHLQMDSLRVWCMERIAPLLVPDACVLEAVWLAALARSCDVLCDACATAWLVAAASTSDDANDTTLLDVLARLQAACGADAPLGAQLVRVLRPALLAHAAEAERQAWPTYGFGQA
jgi:hypothetical protein